MPRISVVIPAHNEELFIRHCVLSVKASAALLDDPVEIIVCLNRCTDGTEAIVQALDVIVVYEEEPNVAKVRNRALQAASGDILVTLDADSTMSIHYLAEVERLMSTGRYLGGASMMFTDKLNVASVLLGIFLVFPSLLLMRFSGGMFWFSREALDATGGFDEHYLTGEDFHFWRTLRQLARARKKHFGMITKACIRTSSRKMNEFGPWFMLTHPHWFYYAIKGNNQQFADRYLYKTSRTEQKKR